MTEINDQPLYECFVSPNICRSLLELGLSSCVGYDWIVHSDCSISLVTRHFDTDKYYTDAWEFLHAAGSNLVLPAFNIKDMEKVLPPWTMTSDLNGYTLMLSSHYQVNEVTSKRLPDAFALMLKELLDKRILKADHVNYIISKHQPA